MARPIIVAGATTQAGAAVGPVQLHGGGPYSRMAGDVKSAGLQHLPRDTGRDLALGYQSDNVADVSKLY
jgi:hypothetical protein